MVCCCECGSLCCPVLFVFVVVDWCNCCWLLVEVRWLLVEACQLMFADVSVLFVV